MLRLVFGAIRRRRTQGRSLRLYDLLANAWATLRHSRAIPPDQLLRVVAHFRSVAA